MINKQSPTENSNVNAELSQSENKTKDLQNTLLNNAYRLEKLIGQGGMSVIYEATQLTLNRQVAVKLLLPQIQASEEFKQRFLREARIVSGLNHPNLVNIYDFGETDEGLLYLVMEKLNGLTLQEFVPKGGLNLEDICQFISGMCNGIAAAHKVPIVHRDLKPGNIFIAEVSGGSRVVKILDFGISKILDEVDQFQTRTGYMVGTPGYSAPEQMLGLEDVDTRTDIYSMGAVLYYMVSGERRNDSSVEALLGKVSATDTQSESIELNDENVRRLLPVVKKAMQAKPADRFETIELFALSVQQCSSQSGDDKTLLSPSYSLRKDVESLDDDKTRISQVVPVKKSSVSWLKIPIALLFLVGAPLAYAWFTNLSIPTLNTPGVGFSKIKIGMSAPFSGPSKELGRAMKLGMETYFSSVNSTLAGVLGRKIELVALDDRYEPDEAIKNAKRLVEQENVFALVGNVGTPTTRVILPYLTQKQTVLYGAFTGADIVRLEPPNRFVFNYRASYAQETAAIVKYLIESNQAAANKIAVFAQQDSFGDAGFRGVVHYLKSKGIHEQDILRVGYERNKMNVQHATQRILENQEKVDAVVAIATYGPSAEFTKILRDNNLNIPIANVSFVGSEALWGEFERLGPHYAEGIIVTQVVPHFNQNSSLVLEYRDALKKYYPNEKPNFVSLEGYIAAKIFTMGLQKSGWMITRDKLINTFEQFSNIDIGFGESIHYGPSNHQASNKVWATRLNQNGEYEVLDL